MFKQQGQLIRQHILRQSRRANVGHIGSCLSIVELLIAIEQVISVPSPTHADRDRMVLSKGHAALALYGALCVRGVLSEKDLESFFQEGTHFGVHPEIGVPGIDFATGSLGQGLGVAAGAALAAKLQDSARKVFVIMSDAEMNEGSVWEAAMFAAQHRLGNLAALVDVNGQQAFGFTKDVLNLHPLANKWQEFGWAVHEVDGHDVPQLVETLQALSPVGPPHVILAKTTFGKGVSYMEGEIPWHYLPMNEEQFAQAMREVGGA